MIVKKLIVEEGGRLFFVSDLHGEIATLKHALGEVGFDVNKDHCVCIGDLIDRGTDSLGTANFFLDDRTGHYHASMGNHDEFTFMDDDHSLMTWFDNGGKWALDLPRDVILDLGSRMKKLPYAIEVLHEGKKYGAVHASVPVEYSDWDDFVVALESDKGGNLRHSAVWDRSVIRTHKYTGIAPDNVKGIDYAIHGHTPLVEALMIGNRFHIDTGVVRGRYLSLVEASAGGFDVLKFNLVN